MTWPSGPTAVAPTRCGGAGLNGAGRARRAAPWAASRCADRRWERRTLRSRSWPGYAAGLRSTALATARRGAGRQCTTASEDHMPDHNVDWETCADDGCIGVRLPTSTKCWAHAVDTELELAFKRLGEHGLLDARGVLITQELLRRLLAAAPQDDQGHAILTDARFDEATFQGGAGFRGATIHGDVRFGGATFQRARQLGPMLVRKSLRLDQAVFHERAQVEVAAAAVCCQRTRFLAGVQLRVRWAQ